VIRQLVFDLAADAAMTRADFFVSPANALALQTVEDWTHWPGRKLVLVGPEGSGKTHLARIWAAMSGGTVVRTEDLAGVRIDTLAQRTVVVEDADQVAPSDEAALFHLHNVVTPAGALMLTAQTPPRDWGLCLPDLVSRLQSAAVARLEAPDDALLSAVLVKLFSDRQIAVAANLIPYLVSRMPRSVGAARGLVAALDAEALAGGRPITRALAGDVLDRMSSR
jgi:chromosomal replication initiation ATPase DnaA